jgi:hypothetical protein
LLLYPQVPEPGTTVQLFSVPIEEEVKSDNEEEEEELEDEY